MSIGSIIITCTFRRELSKYFSLYRRRMYFTARSHVFFFDASAKKAAAKFSESFVSMVSTVKCYTSLTFGTSK